MSVLSLPSLPHRLTSFSPRPNPNPTRDPFHICANQFRRPLTVGLSIKPHNNTHSDATPNSPAGDFLRLLSLSSIVILGLGVTRFGGFTNMASAQMQQETQDTESVETFEDEGIRAKFELWKAKTYALTVPIRIVALNGSIPPIWIKEFLRSQGKRVKFQPAFRQSLKDIFLELLNPLKKGKINPKSAVAADLVTLGDSWLEFAIGKGLIEPINGVEEQDWFKKLSDQWKVYLRRSPEGDLDSQGRIWAVPYRWGSMVIAYNKREFQKRNLAPVGDWSDLWRPELCGKIAMVDSPREIVGAVLKYMGASYNTHDIESQVPGGRHAVLHKLNLLVRQVRLFDSQHYLKAFKSGDVWVAVGWSSDVLPAAKTMSDVAVRVPKSGTSLWVDLWAVPNTATLVTDQIGGRVRGPSPLVHQWMGFCLQPERALPFKEEIIIGASPMDMETTIGEKKPQKEGWKGRPKLDTNIVGNSPPGEILSRCELLEPLSKEAVDDYRWLMSSAIYKEQPGHNLVSRMKNFVTKFWPKMKTDVE